MKTKSIRDFYYKYVSIQSSLMANEYRLTHKEIVFLVECCVYNFDGNDLSDTYKLIDYMTNKKIFNRRSDVSLYKYKIGSKKWAKTGNNIFILPGILGTRNVSDLKMNFILEYEE